MREFIKKHKTEIFALLYIVFPIDPLPELLLGVFGLIDDVFVVLLLLLFGVYKLLSKKN